jgi:amidase
LPALVGSCIFHSDRDSLLFPVCLEAIMAELTITELQSRMAAGELTAVALVESYLRRIAEIDRSGPALNSVIELNPEAPEIAARLDGERREGHVRGPLHGVPILLKDNIDTADRIQTTAGSLALEGNVAAQDATVAARLRAAGAVILGKTNLSEWANFRSSHSTSGWSSRGGQTRNPYALDRNPCGSSSGSGVAVAADLCAAAVGTETDGSIICPAQTNGIVGIKPTLGLVSRAGIIPIAHSQDTAGPMARTVAEAAAVLAALAGSDPRDPATLGHDGPISAVVRDLATPFSVDGLRGARIGLMRNAFGFNPRVDVIMEDALAALRDLGAEIVDPTNLDLPASLEKTETEVLLYEFKADLNAYLAALGPSARVHSLAEVIAFNEAHRDRVMPFFGQDLMLKAEAKGPLTEPSYRNALRANHRQTRREGIDAVLEQHRLDALVAPSGGPAWLTDYVNGDHYVGGNSTPAAVAGYPSITVPAGYVALSPQGEGLPVGISFIGPAWSDAALARYAYAFEQATRIRRPPTFPEKISTELRPAPGAGPGGRANRTSEQ